MTFGPMHAALDNLTYFEEQHLTHALILVLALDLVLALATPPHLRRGIMSLILRGGRYCCSGSRRMDRASLYGPKTLIVAETNRGSPKIVEVSKGVGDKNMLKSGLEPSPGSVFSHLSAFFRVSVS